MTPDERMVGLGITHPEPALDVPCGLCKASEGEPCRSPRALVKGKYHARRIDRALNRHRLVAYRLFKMLENAALKRDPRGPLWSFQSIPHHCGTLGAHVLTDCTPAGGVGLDFRDWVIQHVTEDTPLSDFARDVRLDAAFPRGPATAEDLHGHLPWGVVLDIAIEALHSYTCEVS